jgi:hypothetical protein
MRIGQTVRVQHTRWIGKILEIKARYVRIAGYGWERLERVTTEVGQ